MSGYAIIDGLLAAALMASAVDNLNHMSRSTRHCFRLINVALAIAGAALVLWPLFESAPPRWAYTVILTCIVVVSFIGRRPIDRFTCAAEKP